MMITKRYKHNECLFCLVPKYSRGIDKVRNDNLVLQTFISSKNPRLQQLQPCRYLVFYQFAEEICISFTPCFLKHLPQVGLVWWPHFSCHPVKLLPHQLTRIQWLRWTNLLQTEFQLFASSIRRVCISWSSALVHCPTEGWNWLHLSTVHRIWQDMSKWNDSLKLVFCFFQK